MALDPASLQQHLQQLAQAYGPDLTLAAGPTRVVAAPSAPLAAPLATPRAAPAPTAPTGAARPVATAARAAASPVPPPIAAPDAADPRAAELAALRAEVMPCTRCKLHQGRQTVVFGEGDVHAEVLFVGEAPGANEDRTGRPFVGEAGQLLDRILTGAMGLQRKDVYIANVNKCRPPGNRTPEPDEVAACLPYLQRQVAILRPRVIVCLGRTAAHNLLATSEPMRALRGRELAYDGIPVVVTWHPAYLLRDPSHKRETWDDIKRVNRLLGRPEVPG